MLSVIIPFNKADAERAERLLDLIYWLAEAQQPHCILVSGSDVHAEMRTKVRIAAEVAFSWVDAVELQAVHGETKPEHINHVFRQAAQFANDCVRGPWLWMEADCVPLRKSWLDDIEKSYNAQPRRFLGRHMQLRERRILSRVAVYPRDAIKDLMSWLNNPEKVTFERVANIIPRTTNSGLFEMTKYADGVAIPERAAILNGDRSGRLVEKLMDATAGHSEPISA